MTDTSTADELPPQTNGIVDNGLLDEEERARMRPADIDADVREMERRKRVELIMNSKLFREELERIIETQLRDGSGTTGLLQQISDMVGVNKQAGNVFKSSNCVVPINDIRGIESMGYGKGEKILRCKLAAVFRLIDLYGWTQSANTLITARLNQEDEQFLVNPYGMLFHEITASSLIKVGMQGNVLEQGTTNFSVNVTAFSLHAAVHAARPDLRCIIHVHTPSVVAISALKHGLLPLSQESVVVGEASTYSYLGGLLDADEKDKLARNLGPINKVLLLSNQGALCCGETIEEAFFNARNTILASESQLKLLPLGVDNLVLLNDEARKKIYDAAHKAPESTPRPDQPSILEGKVERKWRVGGTEFEALMRMLDNAGFRTGYIYRHPLVKGEPPKPRNDVEVPPAVSSLGYLLEEEELYRQGLWKKLEGGRKGHDRSRWLNSPNVYQKVEILETGTPDPKKITKWVAEGSPSHSSTPVRIEDVLQFVPKGTNPKEFKQKQQQIKDYRRADKISAGPQSHILEGVTWEEARKMQDAAVTQTGDQVVLMGAASKGIIQRGHQHNATVYKSPYAKNPFDCVTDEELEDYKKVVEKKAKGEYDTDYSESEGLSSAQINKRLDNFHLRSPTSVTSETEEESRDEPQILRIETTTAPKPSQPEVVLSDVDSPVDHFLRAERTSYNSYASIRYEALKVQFPNSRCYRSSSHAGFPNGSYAIPNPVHFHIARIVSRTPANRPIIKTMTKSINNSCVRRRTINNAVSLNLNETHSVALNISLQSVQDFITPFARALNFVELPILKSRSCQTSYLNDEIPQVEPNVKYTPLYVDSFSKTLHVKSYSFEGRILNSLQNNLMKEMDIFNEIAEFNERDQVGVGENLAEFTDDLEMLQNSSIGSSSEGDNAVINDSKLNAMEAFKEARATADNATNVIDFSLLPDHSVQGEEIKSDSSSEEQKSSQISSSIFDSTSNGKNSYNATTFVIKQDGNREEKYFQNGKGVDVANDILDNIGKASSTSKTQNEEKEYIKQTWVDEEVVNQSCSKSPFYKTHLFGAGESSVKTLIIEENVEQDSFRAVDKTIEDEITKSSLHGFELHIKLSNETLIVEAPAHLNTEIEVVDNDQNIGNDEDVVLNEKANLYRIPPEMISINASTSDFENETRSPHQENSSREYAKLNTKCKFSKFPEIAITGTKQADFTSNSNQQEYQNSSEEQKSSEESSSILNNDSSNENSLNENTFVVDHEHECSKNYGESASKFYFLTASDMLNDIKEESGKNGHEEVASSREASNQISQSSIQEQSIVNDYFLENQSGHPARELTETEIFNTTHVEPTIEFCYEGEEGTLENTQINDASVIAEETDIVKHYPSFASESIDSVNLAEHKSDLITHPDDYKTAEAIAQIVKRISQQEISRSIDEGFEDPLTTTGVTVWTPNVDERVVRLATAIADYLLDQGFEVQELVVFPEIASDELVVKVLSRLKNLYGELYPDGLSSEDLNCLRLSVGNCVITLLSIDERISDDSSDNLLNVSDKVFTISEYVSEFLDVFFGSMDEDFAAFSRDVSSRSIAKSTPDKQKFAEDLDVSITTFQKESKGCSESLWITISPSVPRKNKCLSSTTGNVDQTPLRPPSDLWDEVNRLSPIREEPRSNLFEINMLPDWGTKSTNSSSSEDYEILEGPCSNCTEVAGQDSSSLEKRRFSDINVVVSNEVNFYRTKSTVPGFSQTRSIAFTADVTIQKFQDDEGNKENLDDSGDWMGYEGENTVNGDQSDAHMSTLSQSSKEDRSISEGSPKKDKKKKKGLRTPSFLKKKKEKKSRDA